MCVGAPCSLLRLAKSESARVTACFRGAGPLDAAAADPAALAAAAEADGCTAAHAHAPLGGGVDRKDDIAAKTVSAPGVGGVREASSCGVPQESTMSRQSSEDKGGCGCREGSPAQTGARLGARARFGPGGTERSHGSRGVSMADAKRGGRFASDACKSIIYILYLFAYSIS
jgi:hypothetical protein